MTRMVTRTIITTKVTALCLDLVTAEPYNETITLSGTFNSKKDALKAFSKVYDVEDEKKAVAIVDCTEEETLYGMSEQEFLQYAKVLPKRGAKKLEESHDIPTCDIPTCDNI